MKSARRWAALGIATLTLLGTAVIGPQAAQADTQIPNLAFTDWQINTSGDHTFGVGIRILTQDTRGRVTGVLWIEGIAGTIPVTGFVAPGAASGGNSIALTAENASLHISFTGMVNTMNAKSLFMAGAFTTQSTGVGSSRHGGPYPFCAEGGPTIP